MRSKGNDVYIEPEGTAEVNARAAAGDNEFVHKPLGNQNMKQWSSAAGYLQESQHHFIFGDMQEAKLGSGTLLTKDMRNRRRCENQRKHNSLVDAAKNAPEMRDPAKINKIVEYFGGQLGSREQSAGLRTAARFFFQMQTMARGETPRNQRMCHRLRYSIPPMPDVPGSQQPIQLLANTKDIGKTAIGETKSVTAVARHRDVRHTHMLVALQCSMIMNALSALHTSHCT